MSLAPLLSQTYSLRPLLDGTDFYMKAFTRLTAAMREVKITMFVYNVVMGALYDSEMPKDSDLPDDLRLVPPPHSTVTQAQTSRNKQTEELSRLWDRYTMTLRPLQSGDGADEPAPPTTSELNDMAERLLEGVRRMQAIIEQHLLYSKVMQGTDRANRVSLIQSFFSLYGPRLLSAL